MHTSCTQCGVGLVASEQGKGICYKCEQAAQRGDVRQYLKAQEEELNAVLVTAEPSPDLPIKARKGIITAECMFALNSVKDLMVGIRDAFGGRSKTIQKELRRMRETVITELKQEALAVGANAVISVSLEYSQMTGKGDPFLFIAAVGTAVEISDNKGV